MIKSRTLEQIDTIVAIASNVTTTTVQFYNAAGVKVDPHSGIRIAVQVLGGH